MPRFFVGNDAVAEGVVTITGDDAAHIGYSLRMRPSEKLTVCGADAREYECEIERITKDAVFARILSSHESKSESPCFVSMFVAASKGDRMEYAIQKSVECGVSQIVPFCSERTLVGPDSVEKKLDRWRKIAKEASQQSGRGIVPRISAPIDFQKALLRARESQLSFMCWEEETSLSLYSLLEQTPTPATVSFIIGPEGGLSRSEADAARNSGIPTVSLGNRILRCESAPPFVLACLAFRYELPGR